MQKRPETLEEYQAKLKECLSLLLEARDALPAMTTTAAKLHGVRLDLAERIEQAMEPWRIE